MELGTMVIIGIIALLILGFGAPNLFKDKGGSGSTGGPSQKSHSSDVPPSGGAE